MIPKRDSGSKTPLFSAGMWRNVPPAIINPYACIGYVGLGTSAKSPGAVIADAKLAKPSFELITNQLKKDIVSKEVNNYTNKEDKIDFDFIELKNLKYSIPENKRILFNNVNFIIKKNEITGIKGESGVGKSTLIDILSTFKKPTNGSVLAGNFNIHEHSLLWQKKISYVPQEIFLLDDTIYMNVCLKKSQWSI